MVCGAHAASLLIIGVLRSLRCGGGASGSVDSRSPIRSRTSFAGITEGKLSSCYGLPYGRGSVGDWFRGFVLVRGLPSPLRSRLVGFLLAGEMVCGVHPT